MKCVFMVGMAVMFTTIAPAQHRQTATPMIQRGFPGTGGRIPAAPPLLGKSFPGVGGALPLVGPGFPAIGGALPLVNPFSGNIGFAQRLGATISGIPPFRGGQGFGGGRHGFRHGNRGFIGYGGYPLLYPTFGPLEEGYDQSGQTQARPPAQQAVPSEMESQNFSTEPQQEEYSGVQTYSAPSAPRPEPPDDRPLFFIALTDSSVYTAVAYWVENGTLNYVTPQGRHNQVSLTLIDRDTTERLNRGSKFQLHLPGA